MAATIARSIMAVRSTGATLALSHSLRVIHSTTVNSVRCRVTTPSSSYSPHRPGCDYERWLIFMDKPGGEGATDQQMVECYVQTLAKVLGSEEEAMTKIYDVSCERYCSFGCEIDEETSNKLEALPGVLFVLPDSYLEPENQDYTEMNQTRGRRVTASARSRADVGAGNRRRCGGGGSAR